MLQELAPLRDTPSTKREELFKKKLELCSICFDFDDPTSDKVRFMVLYGDGRGIRLYTIFLLVVSCALFLPF